MILLSGYVTIVMHRYVLLVTLALASCQTTGTPAPSAPTPADIRLAEDLKAVILSNQECYSRFDRIERSETVTIIERARDGSVLEERPRQESVHDIVQLANDRSGLLGVTVHPFFSARDSFSVKGRQSNRIILAVSSSDPDVRHYMEDIVVEVDQDSLAVVGLSSGIRIHGYYGERRTVDKERLTADWVRLNGCDLPGTVRYHPLSDRQLDRPRLVVDASYSFVE